MTDVMRKKYRPLTPGEELAMVEIKEAGEAFLRVLTTNAPRIADPRHAALARTKIEEAVMWAVKGVTG